MEEEIYILGPTLLENLEVRSSIDVMHVTKNLCVNLLGFLGVYGKTKDTAEAREDLQRLHEKDDMPPKQYEGPASYDLTSSLNACSV